MQAGSTTLAELADLSHLIDAIYQGATEPSRWNDIIPAIARWVGATRGVLFTPLNTPDNGGFYFSHEISEAVAQTWLSRYLGQDIWAIRARERGLNFEGNVFVGDEQVSFQELSNTLVYQEFFSKHDIAHLMSGVVFGLESVAKTPHVACTLLRGVHEPAFTHMERDRLNILVPHLSRALGVMTRLRDAELKVAASRAALDRMSVGVLLLLERRRVIFANHRARRILREEDGLLLKPTRAELPGHELVAQAPSAHAQLMVAMGNAVSQDILQTPHFSQAVVVPRPSGRQDYVLNFSSLSSINEFGVQGDNPRAIVFLTDSDEPTQLDGDLLKKTYKLSPAEIRVAQLLLEGLTVEEAAERLGVVRSTAKSQLQSIYAKTHTNNRAKLMRLLMSLTQVMG